MTAGGTGEGGRPVRAVAQRVRQAAVDVSGVRVAAIGLGLCVFVAAGRGDGPADVRYMADKLAHLRVFSSAAEPAGAARMTLSPLQAGGEVLLIPQFTLYGDVRHGRRPDFAEAARPQEGRALLAELALGLRQQGLVVGEGVFGADMRVQADNDGPVTILLDSRRAF